MENIHRAEELGHFSLVIELSDESIALLEAEIGYIRGKLKVLKAKGDYNGN